MQRGPHLQAHTQPVQAPTHLRGVHQHLWQLPRAPPIQLLVPLIVQDEPSLVEAHAAQALAVPLPGRAVQLQAALLLLRRRRRLLRLRPHLRRARAGAVGRPAEHRKQGADQQHATQQAAASPPRHGFAVQL